MSTTSSTAMRPRSVLVTVAGLALLTLAGCNSSSDAAQPSAVPAPGSASSAATGSAPSQATSAAPASGSATPASGAPASSTAGPASATTASASQQPSAVSTPVPAPGGGNINQTVAPSAVATPAPSSVNATVQPVSGVKVSIVPKSAKLVAKLPGDVSGAGITVTVTIHNGSSRSLPVGDTVVSVTRPDGSPAPEFTGDPAKPIAGTLAPGRTATGVYAFRLPENQRGKVRIEVRGNPVMGIAVYQGQV